MKDNKLRSLLRDNIPTCSTRLWSTWPFYTEAVGATGKFDYIEYVAEYSPFSQNDLENIARAAEIHNMSSMIKLDFFNRGYIAQKAIASGFQAILFTDHRNADQVRESIQMVKPETAEDKGLFGYPNRRFIGTQSHLSQTDHAKRLREIVLCFMIEKQAAVDNIEEICSVPGVDMIQFGPSDYCMSNGWNRSDHISEFKTAERHCIEVAQKHGVAARCEIQTPDEAQYYIDLGVRHFSLGDEFAKLKAFWNDEGKKMRAIADSLQ
jgi:2-keto-3-deoxy-L-rhamnonate aldolase RhmA